MSKSLHAREIEQLEQSFWQSMVDGDVKVATGMLTEPAVMVSGHGASKFDHAGYERMAADDRYKLVDYKLSKFDVVSPTEDVAIATYHVAQSMEREGEAVETEAFDSSTWVKLDAGWKCVAHTESPGAAAH